MEHFQLDGSAEELVKYMNSSTYMNELNLALLKALAEYTFLNEHHVLSMLTLLKLY